MKFRVMLGNEFGVQVGEIVEFVHGGTDLVCLMLDGDGNIVHILCEEEMLSLANSGVFKLEERKDEN